MPSCGTVRILRGPRGLAGADGDDGADGVSAFTTLTAAFTMPAELATAVATVADTFWMTTGNTYYLQGAGWLQVTAIGGATSVTLRNLEDAAASAYPANVAPGTIIPIASKLVAAGIQGPGGTAGSSGAPTTASYLTKTDHIATLPNSVPMSGLGTGLMFNTIGTGATSIVTRGVANANVAPVDDAAGLVLNEAVFGTATGIKSENASTARGHLGLGTVSTQAASAVAITGGAISGTTIAGSTGSFTTLAASGATALAGILELSAYIRLVTTGVQSLLAANTISFASTRAKVVGNGGPVTLTSTPSVQFPVADGVLLLIQGTDNTNTITINDEATMPGSGVQLGAATRVLGSGDTLLLIYDSTAVQWYEVAYSNN